MTYDDEIQVLISDLNRLGSRETIFDAWLDTTLEHLGDIYDRTSTQYQNFFNLRHEYKTHKISSFFGSTETSADFMNRANQQLKGIIEQLKRERNRSVADQQNEEKERKRKEEEEKSKPAFQPVKKRKMGVKKKHYTIGIGVFWSIAAIVITIMGFLYYFGNENGKTKFEQEKINMFEENKTLKKDLSDSKDTIRLLNNTVESWKSLADRYYNSLSKQQKDSLGKVNF